jgi:ferric-dicitrate binding protein FerR (iron transport regulator)
VSADVTAIPGASSAKAALLRAGTQAVVESGRDITVGSANLEEALAWKNGLFVFQSESLESIARRLSRWYNVDIVFEDNHLRNIRFTGRVRRYDDMNVLLDMIGATSRATFVRQGLQVVVSAR